MLRLQDLQLTPPEKLWLQAVYDNGGIPDPQTFKVKFHGQLPKEFNYTNLNRAFLWGESPLNVFGIWLLNPNDELFGNLDKTIKTIAAEIRKNPKFVSINAEKVSELTGIQVEKVKEVLGHLGQLGGFLTGATGSGNGFGIEAISFSGAGYIDAYLNYTDTLTLLEEVWKRYRQDLYIRPEIIRETGETRLCYSKLCHVVVFGKKKWSFHTNAAKVVRILVQTYKRGLPEIHIDEIHGYLPKEIQSDSLSQIFKSHKGESWKELVITGISGKGFWQLNPKYLEKGVEEIDLGLIE